MGITPHPPCSPLPRQNLDGKSLPPPPLQRSALPDMRISLDRNRRYLLVIKNLTFLYSHFWHIAEAVQRAGWDVWIVAGKTADPSRLFDSHMNYIETTPAATAWDVIADLKVVGQTRRALREVKPDLVHFIYLKNVLVGGILARLSRTPAVIGAITGMGSLFAEDRMSYKVIRSAVLLGLRAGYRGTNSLIALENSDDEELLTSCGAVRSDRTGIIPGAGLDRDAIVPAPSSTGVPVVLCAARMIQQKGVQILIEAARVLYQRGLRFEVWLAGATDPSNPYSLREEDLKAAGEDGPVKWLGHRADMAALLHQCSLVCLPTFYREGLPRSLVEAAAAGRAIVATNVPGCREIVTHGHNGLLVQPRNIEELVDSLEDLILNEELRNRMGEASRQVFESRYTREAVLAAFNDCYRRLGVDLRLGIEK